MLLAAHQIGPADRLLMVQLEAPMGPYASRLQRFLFRIGECQRRAIINRGKTSAELDFALEIKLLRALITGIEPPGGNQLGKTLFIKGKALGLLHLGVGMEAEPSQVRADAIGIFRFRPFGIGIIQPQQKAPAMATRPEPVMKRRAQIADMQMPGGRGGEAGDDGGHDLTGTESVGDRIAAVAAEIAAAQLDAGRGLPPFVLGDI